MKKYLVCPEQVFCGNDHDVYSVSAEEIIRSYQVDPKECVIQVGGKIEDCHSNLTLLLPDYTGEYEIPGESDGE